MSKRHEATETVGPMNAPPPDDYKHDERKIELTARACHETMRVMNFAVGKMSLPAWADAGAPAQGRSIRGVVRALDGGVSETVEQPIVDDSYAQEQYRFQCRKADVFAKVARLVGAELGLRVS
jgi:hypothetical protein